HHIFGIFPTLVEQREIASVLKLADDAVTAGRAKLLAERRLKAAMMQTLFTRGIPGRHTQFKRTKIGEIPVSWKAVTLQTVTIGTPFNGISPQSRPQPPGTPILNVECIDDGLCSVDRV